MESNCTQLSDHDVYQRVLRKIIGILRLRDCSRNRDGLWTGISAGADGEKHTKVIQNMASGLTGMICDGGNHGCTMKGIVAVDAAFRATDMAMDDICIENIHGINGRTPEATMKYMGMIASPGMIGTEKTIVEIMESKK